MKSELVPLVEQALSQGMYTVFDLVQKFSVNTTDIIEILRILKEKQSIRTINIGAIYYTSLEV